MKNQDKKDIKRYIRDHFLIFFLIITIFFSLITILIQIESTKNAIIKEEKRSIVYICSELNDFFIYHDYLNLINFLENFNSDFKGVLILDENGNPVYSSYKNKKAKKILENLSNKSKENKEESSFKIQNGNLILKCSVLNEEKHIISEIFFVKECKITKETFSTFFQPSSIFIYFLLLIISIFFILFVSNRFYKELRTLINFTKNIKKEKVKTPISPFFQEIYTLLNEMLENHKKIVGIYRKHSENIKKELAKKELKLKELKETLSSLENELTIETSKVKYEARMSLVSKVITDIVNELTPIIRSLSDDIEKFLIDKKINEYEREKLFRVYKSSNRIIELLLQMESIVKSVTFTKIELNLSDLLKELLNETTIPDYYQIQYEIEEGITILGSHSRIKEALIELLKNSIDAMKNSKEKIIKVRLKKRNKLAIITIEDTGPGFKEPDKAFDPFYTDKVSPFHKGLGLTMVKKIILEHNGEITLLNTEKGGARVEIFLPIKNGG